MRELYFIACGVVLGITFRDWLEAHERRVAWKAMELVAEDEQRRRTWREQNPDPVEPVTAPAAA